MDVSRPGQPFPHFCIVLWLLKTRCKCLLSRNGQPSKALQTQCIIPWNLQKSSMHLCMQGCPSSPSTHYLSDYVCVLHPTWRLITCVLLGASCALNFLATCWSTATQTKQRLYNTHCLYIITNISNRVNKTSLFSRLLQCYSHQQVTQRSPGSLW